MEGEDVSAFAFTYRTKMTGELGHLKIEGYEFWEAFRGQCILQFALMHEGGRSLALMTKLPIEVILTAPSSKWKTTTPMWE